MFIRKELDHTIAEGLTLVSRDQLTAALQLAVMAAVDTALNTDPKAPPSGDALARRAAAFNDAMAEVLNTAADLLDMMAAAKTEPAPQSDPAAEQRAADAAADAIAKARKLH